MTSLYNLLKQTPETLAETQFIELKNAVVERLRLIATLIKNNRFEDALEHLEHSPAGDGHGCENDFISFGDILDPLTHRHDTPDLGAAIGRLIQLHDLSRRNKKD